MKSYGHEISYFSTKDPNNAPTVYEDYFVDAIEYFDKKGLVDKVKATLRFVHSGEAADKLDALLKVHRPDVAHLHVFQSRLSASIIKVLKKHKVPMVMTVHEYKLLCPTYTMINGNDQLCERCGSGGYHHCIINKCNKKSYGYSVISAMEAYYRDLFIPCEKWIDHFIMISDFVYNKHVSLKSVFEGKSTRLYNFLNIDNYPYSTEKQDHFLFFGRLIKEKGVLTLIEAFRQRPELQLRIVGTGPMEEDIDTFIQDNGISNIQLLGFKKGEELTKEIAQSKFVIIPSEWYEPFGLTTTEAMATGTPVIGASIGAIPELIQEKRTGFLFAHGQPESLAGALTMASQVSAQTYRSMSENARSFVEDNFSKEEHYQQLLQIYTQVINQYQS